ncbi:hypothetical protein IGI86_000714 [Enterococcus sp. AZ188]|uniref:HTH domain-containing protein n=1 Tax=Enterococcus sp. AZ188 TaxID=2774678 RepID=UPI003D2FF667
MSQLFYDLIYQEKTKRWLTILNYLEVNQTMTAKELAEKLGCTTRTIQTDIKQIKRNFDASILLLGDEDGYHFSFQDPVMYTNKKQALLEHEPLFLLEDQLIAGTRRTNKEWAEVLSLSPASFGRLKRFFVQLLNDRYCLTIIDKSNRLYGEESAIRQFMYDLYFTLPLYPKYFEKRIESWSSFNQVKRTGSWELDPVCLNQWIQLAQWRIDQDQYLQPKESQEETQKQLANAFDETVTLSFPLQEKAALFLLSLKEEQFLDHLRQKEFIRQFSSENGSSFSQLDSEGITFRFFETMIALMNQFFLIKHYKGKEDWIEEQTDEKHFINNLIKNYYESKTRLERSLLLEFQLEGSSALQRWIKKVVRHQLQSKGYYLIESVQKIPYTHQITVTNTRIPLKKPHMVCLSSIPKEREIEQALKVIDW